MRVHACSRRGRAGSESAGTMHGIVVGRRQESQFLLPRQEPDERQAAGR